jgi:C-terminal processing protease CtpA/Prc
MKTQFMTGLLMAAALTPMAGVRAAVNAPAAASGATQAVVAQRQIAESERRVEQDQHKLAVDQQKLAGEQQGTAVQQQQSDLNQQQLDQEMQQARQKMQAAAQQMAQAVMQMQGPMLSRLPHMFDPNRAILGVSVADSKNAQSTAGVSVEAVTPGGPADTAGMRAGDVITAINGVSFKSTSQESAADQLMDFMDKVKPGDTLKLSYVRAGQARDATVKAGRLSDYSFALGPPPPPAPPIPPTPPVPPALPHNLRALFAPGWWGPWADMQLVQLTPSLGQYFGTDHGVLVVRAPRDAALKLEDGDVILKIGDRQPATPAEAVRILYSYAAGQAITLHILRKDKPLTVRIIAPKISSPAMGPYQPMNLHDR